MPAYTVREEILNSIAHGLGELLAVASLTLLVTLASVYGNAWSVVSCAIFGATMMLMYGASTLYHAVPSEQAKKYLKKFDHISIYYFIAGSYTPFLLVLLRGAWGWSLFGCVWALALLGTYLKLALPVNGTKKWSILLYLGMGWLVMVALKEVYAHITTTGLVFLSLGGAFYTLGILFYIWKSRRYTHAIWHFFVLIGSLMHVLAVLFSCVFLT